MSARNGTSNAPVITVGLSLFAVMLTALWKAYVQKTVPDPYLDEVFHVRQAQAYCAEEFQVWDPKITTPPGLYLIAFAWNYLFGCDADKLRLINVVLHAFFFTQLLYSRDVIDLVQRGLSAKTLKRAEEFTFQDWLKAFNIFTFPPLFFFSALFYTDVASTVVVFLYFQLFVHRLLWKVEDARKEIFQVFLGVLAMLFRQTNVFWVAIFPAGLALVQGAKSLSPQKTAREGPRTFAEVFHEAWNESVIYDPPVAEAWLDDYVKAGLSIGIVSALHIGKLITPLYPPLMLLNVFIAFVVWNGGVVLGDKSNHVATIHIPQMLYIWPYMLFFSWPLTVPTVFRILQGALAPQSPLLLLRRLAVFAGWTGLAVAAVHFNTVIHPFLLADNRHYMFYVFKVFRQHPELYYLLTPLYIISAYLIIQTLWSQPPQAPSSPDEKPTEKAEDNAAAPTQQQEVLAWLCPSGVRTSYVLIWTLTTTLTLITAPLVEPRYAILPWLFWRLHVPVMSTSSQLPDPVKQRVESRPVGRMMSSADARMRLEMVWHVVVNAVTGYMFLYRGFEWPGKEYEGVVQRFMW